MRFHNSRAIVKQDTNTNKSAPTMTMLPLRMTHIQPARKQPTDNKINNAIYMLIIQR